MSKRRFHISAGAVLAAALLFFFMDTATLWTIALPVAAHELGHVIALRLLGLRIRGFRAELKGLCIDYCGFCGTAGHLFAAAAGPVDGLLYAFAASYWAKLFQNDTAALSAGISLLLSLFNLLPVLPLDGGRIFFLAVDAVSLLIFKRKVPEKYQAAVNTAGFVVLMGFMLLVTFHDVFKLFQ